MDTFTMPFGKYQGESLDWIFENDPRYLEWCRDNIETDEVREQIEDYLEERKFPR